MNKILLSLSIVTALIFTGCKYDDTYLSERVDNLEQRVANLEELCKQMNNNISSLQTLVNALQENDFITDVNPLYEGGNHIGYTIDFAKSESITIYHGKDGQNGKDGVDGNHGTNGQDGKDGYTPSIGIAQDTDGHYYWTLDGEWLLDNNGQKVSAEGLPGKDGQNGTDGKDGQNGTNGKDGVDGTNGSSGTNGKDGITPQFKIEDGDWYISFDNGLTWEYLGRATGADGKDGINGTNGKNGQDGDSIFKSIDTSDPDFVTFLLADGTEIKIPRHSALSIIFDEDDLLVIGKNTTREIGYTVTSDKETGLKLEVLSSGNVKAKLSSSTAKKGVLTITTGNLMDPEYDKVVVLVTDGYRTIMSSFSFEEAGLEIKSGKVVEANPEGETLALSLYTNCDYTLSIPQNDLNWIYEAPSSRSWSVETVSVKVERNDGDVKRFTTIDILDREENILESVTVTQDPVWPTDMELMFPDPIFREYVKNFDTDKDGKISRKEAENVTFIFCAQKGIKDLTGIQYFTNLTSLDCSMNELTELDMTKNLNLRSLDCSINKLTKFDVTQNTALTDLSCSFNQLMELDVTQNTALTVFGCGNNKGISNLDLTKNTALSRLICNDNKLTKLDVTNNTELTDLYCAGNQLSDLDLTKNMRLRILECDENYLTKLDVTNNTDLTRLHCKSNELTELDVTKSKALTQLYCRGNKLTKLDVTNNTDLTDLDCSQNELTELCGINNKLERLVCSTNKLTKLDVTTAMALINLNCSTNKLRELDLTKNKSLLVLSCAYNELTNLDVTHNTALKELICSNNELTNLNVTQNSKLQNLNCGNNQLIELDVSNTDLINYQRPSSYFYALYCNMESLKTLYIKNEWELPGINATPIKFKDCINESTQIEFKD